MRPGKFVKNTTYYTGTVYEWNLPTGHSCPFALQCKVSVDRETGKFTNDSEEYRCYASSAERFPGVREHRWNNFNFVRNGGVIEIPKGCENIRIHASGDFFNHDYFNMWVKIATNNPEINFWAFTKSIGYWVDSLPYIPDNFILTASYGGRQDHLISENRLKSCRVYSDISDVPDFVPIDNNDDWARQPSVNFALLDNNVYKKRDQIKRENCHEPA